MGDGNYTAPMGLEKIEKKAASYPHPHGMGLQHVALTG
jgi:hypothetical protein